MSRPSVRRHPKDGKEESLAVPELAPVDEEQDTARGKEASSSVPGGAGADRLALISCMGSPSSGSRGSRCSSSASSASSPHRLRRQETPRGRAMLTRTAAASLFGRGEGGDEARVLRDG